MVYSQETYKFAKSIVLNYSNYDNLNKLTLNIKNIPDFDIFKLVSLLMVDNRDISSEATGPDNNFFFNSMVPSLINYLSNIHNSLNQEEFLSSWREGISSYFYDGMVDLLNNILEVISGDSYTWAA